MKLSPAPRRFVSRYELMARVKVYRLKTYNISTDADVVLPRLSTREGAAGLGEIIEDTETEIDDSELDSEGRWTARANQ